MHNFSAAICCRLVRRYDASASHSLLHGSGSMPASAGVSLSHLAGRTALSPGGDRSCCSPSVDLSAGRHWAGLVAPPPQLSMRFAAPPLHALSGVLRWALDRCQAGPPVKGPHRPSCWPQTPFQEPPPLQGLPRTLESLPPAVALFGAVVVVALSGAGGAALGNQLPGARTCM